METVPVELDSKELDRECTDILGSYDLFESRAAYISGMRTYYFHFRAIPSMKAIYDINNRRAIKWVETNFSNEILKKHCSEVCTVGKRNMHCVNVLFILKGAILVEINGDGFVEILFQQKSEEQAQKLLNEIKRFKYRTTKTTHISLVVSGSKGLRLVDAKTKKPKLEVTKHYNDDLSPLHETILKSLRKKDNNGLILFHGIPGTGKSTYIRYLIHCQKKRVIFLPPRLAGNLDSPELINLLIENPNSILVIEDAEDLLKSRDSNNNSGISMLLNLTDGILGESLGIQVICTFNTHVSNIDKALLRKGRLLALYEFKALAPHKANALLEEMGVNNYLPAKAITLAELYHIQEQQFEFNSERQNKIGFMAQVA